MTRPVPPDEAALVMRRWRRRRGAPGNREAVAGAVAGAVADGLEIRRLLSATVQFAAAGETVNASAGSFSIPVTLTGTPDLGATAFGAGYDVLKTPDGSAIDSSGNLYVADNASNGPVLKIAPNGAVTPVATNFGGGIPSGLALDSSGNLYVACYGTNNVYKVTPAGATSIFATGFGTPDGLAFDSAGNLYVANYQTSTVSKVTPAGSASTFASALSSPEGLAFDSAGNLYVTSNTNNSVNKITTGGTVTPFASGFKEPEGLSFDSAGNLYVCNYLGSTISKVTAGGAVSTYFGAGLRKSNDVAFDSAGNLYVSDANTDTVQKVTPAGVVSTFATLPTGFATQATALAFDPSGNLYVGQNNGNIQKVTPAGVVTPFVSGFSPQGLACDAAGNLYASGPDSTGTSIIRKITPAGTVTTFATGFSQAQGLTFRGGNLYTADLQAGTVDKVTSAGVVSTYATIGGTEPISLAFDSAGNLFVGSLAYPTVTKVAPDGTVSPYYSENGTSALGIAVDPSNTVYFANASNSVSRISTAVSVPFTLSGTAASGTDYANVTPSPLLFAPGQTTANITGTLFPHPGASPTLTLTLGTPSINATLGTTSSNTATITETTAAPTVVSVTPQDSAGRGAAAGSTGGQRSIVSQVVVVFSQKVNLAAGAFTLGLVNNYGSGANNGPADTDVSTVLGNPANPSNDGLTWVIPVVQAGTSTTYSYNLGAAAAGACLQDGVYHLNVKASAVTSAGVSMTSDYASALFHRIYGDTDGNKTVNPADYAKFKSAFGSSTGAAAYNADLDADGNGTINAADYAQFKKRFGLTFNYT